MPASRTLALLTLPLLLLGGCKSVTTLGDTMGSTFGISDAPTQAGDTDETSIAQRTGVTVADEPLAARAGSAVLASGGNAVDAVTAMFFTLAATYPVSAGLGGGGICLVGDGSGVAEYDFLVRAPAGGGAYAVPGAVHGFYDLQKARGVLPWQRDVAPGEGYAATGFPISQALAARLPVALPVLRLDAALAAEFLDESGQPRPVGTVVINPALAQTLSDIRLGGADGFYKGNTAARIAAYAAQQGGGVSTADLMATGTIQTSARARRIGSMTAWLPAARTGAGAFSGALMDNLARARQTGRSGEAAIQTALSETIESFGISSLPQDLGSTGFAAVDASGTAATCTVTLNGPFGSGRTAAGTGVQLANTPTSPQMGLASAFLMPMIGTVDGAVTLAGSGAGGPNGPAAAAIALLQSSAGRLGARGDLRGAGTAPQDAVNVITCGQESVCVPLADPGGHGLGASSASSSTGD